MPKSAAKKTTTKKAATATPKTAALGFEAGKTGRRLAAIPTTTQAINSLVRRYGRNAVARSRYLSVNNAYAASAREEFKAALAGTGIKPSPLGMTAQQKRAALVAWSDWTDESDADGVCDFYGQQEMIAGELFDAGECFVRFRPRLSEDGLLVPLQIQILPSEMLPFEKNEVLGNGRRIESGIEFDAIGRRVAYHFYANHPGEMPQRQLDGRATVRVPADEVLHIYRPIRAGQIRGIPHTLASMVALAMLDLYDDAELERKRIAALFAAFVLRKEGETEEDNPLADTLGGSNPADTPSDFSLEPGAVIDLMQGQDVKFAEPADVGDTYESFQVRNLMRIAAGFGVPYASMTGDLRQVNYSSIRAGLVAFRRRIESLQHHVMVFQFCRPVWRRWIREAVRVGAISEISASAYTADERRFWRVKWIPPKWEWVDPLKDLQAEKLAVDSGFKSRDDVIESSGYDAEEVDARIKAAQDRATEAGLSFIRLTSGAVVSPDTGENLVGEVTDPAHPDEE